MRLKKLINIEVSTDLADLQSLFDHALGALRSRTHTDRRAEIDLAGAAQIKQIVLADLGMVDRTTSHGCG
jgi:hypothetical protein